MRFFVWWSFIFLVHYTPIKTIGYQTDVIEISCYLINQLPSMTSKWSHHFDSLLMIIGVLIQQRISLQRYNRLTMSLILWLIKTLRY